MQEFPGGAGLIKRCNDVREGNEKGMTIVREKYLNHIRKYPIQQIEKPVRWRESINNMINLGVNSFIEMGPGKVLSGLVKRIDRNVKLNQVNNFLDTKNLLND